MTQEDASQQNQRTTEPFCRVYVATDFSAPAGHAAVRAALLPLAEHAKITLLHVLSERIPRDVRPAAEQKAREALETLRGEVRAALTSAKLRDVEVLTDLCEGQPYVEIIRHARAAAADLIVLGRHGSRPVKDMILGTTAERVIRAGDLPVLVVNRNASQPYESPLLAVDLEDTSRAIVTLALRALGAHVTEAAVVHAYHVPFEGFITPGAAPEAMTSVRKEHRQMAAEDMARFLKGLEELGVSWRTRIVRGDPRSAIPAEVRRQHADLLVMGTHGRSGLSHALIGSVAAWVIQAVACDVLVARAARTSFALP